MDREIYVNRQNKKKLKKDKYNLGSSHLWEVDWNEKVELQPDFLDHQPPNYDTET